MKQTLIGKILAGLFDTESAQTGLFRLLRSACCCTVLIVLMMPGGIALGQNSSVALFDNFTQDSSLNTALWTTSSALLNSLAAASSSPPASFVTPQLSFRRSGMKMTGLTQNFQTTGVQSLSTFTPPFRLITLVAATQGTGDPFEVFLVSADLTQFLTVTGNVNPVYQGIWATATNVSLLWQLGDQLSPPISTAFGTPYRIEIDVSAHGAATVTVESSDGTQLGSVSGLQPGVGPFYLVLGQRIGLTTPGSQVAFWRYVRVTTR
jgi:hypothetical protein